MEKVEIKKEELVNNEESKTVKGKKLKVIIQKIIFNFLYPYLIFCISNMCNKEFFLMKKMIFMHIFETPAFIVTIIYELLIIIGFSILFKVIFKKSIIRNICLSILFQTISIISFYKVAITQKPFLPEDILLVGNALEIAKYGNLTIQPIIIIQIFVNIIVLLIQGLITSYTKWETITKKKSINILKLCLAIIILISTLFFSWGKYLPEEKYVLKSDYRIYSGVIYFFKNVYKLVDSPKLDIYSQAKLEEIKSQVENTENQEIEETGVKPNIIVVMAESLSDPTKIKDVTYTADPLSTYRQLSKQYASGNAIVDIYGGETSMSEFEFLTASTARFLNGKRYPYSQIIKTKTNSILTTLSHEGYYNIAIHPNDGNFYNRINVYRDLGFNKMVFKEDFGVTDDTVSDKDTAKQIIQQYENCNEDKKFIFTITIESHLPYEETKYDTYNIDVKSDKFSEEEIKELKTYSQGIYNLDKSYEYLVDYFSQREEPVMIVLFGDHLPHLNKIHESAFGESIEKYSTPYIIWTNYDLKLEGIENVSLGGLSMYMLENANINLPWYYKYISNFYKEYPVFTERYVIDKNKNLCDSQNIKGELIDNYNILQYDLLHKKTIK